MPSQFVLPNVRLSFPNIWTRAVWNGEEKKFEATGLIDKDSQADLIELCMKNANIALIEKYGTEKMVPRGILTERHFCLRDGDNVAYDGYANHMSFKAANGTRPKTMDRMKNPITEDSGLLYAGCYCDMIVKYWVQDNTHGKKLNANLLALRHRGDGAPFGAGGIPDNVADDFEDLEEEALPELGEDDI